MKHSNRICYTALRNEVDQNFWHRRPMTEDSHFVSIFHMLSIFSICTLLRFRHKHWRIWNSLFFFLLASVSYDVIHFSFRLVRMWIRNIFMRVLNWLLWYSWRSTFNNNAVYEYFFPISKIINCIVFHWGTEVVHVLNSFRNEIWVHHKMKPEFVPHRKNPRIYLRRLFLSISKMVLNFHVCMLHAEYCVLH